MGVSIFGKFGAAAFCAVTMTLILAAGCAGTRQLSGADSGAGASSADTVIIAGTAWMKRNLNVETADSWCYKNDPGNCAKFGRLYTWDAAVSACSALGEGWRLPSDDDWNALTEAAGGESTGGAALRSKSGWVSKKISIAGTDDFGFSALPGGVRNFKGKYSGAGYGGGWWSGTEAKGHNAYARFLGHSAMGVESASIGKDRALSVRCVFGETAPATDSTMIMADNDTAKSNAADSIDTKEVSLQALTKLIGVWEGSYFNGQAKTETGLTIDIYEEDNKFIAKFLFAVTPESGESPGVYKMRAYYDRETKGYRLNLQEWNRRLSGYSDLNLSAALSDDEVFIGETAHGGSFKVTRKGKE